LALTILRDKSLEDVGEAFRYLFYGPAGVGKSRMLATIPMYELMKGTDPEDIHVFVLDLDDGFITVLKSQFPKDWWRFFTVIPIAGGIDDIRDAVNFIHKEVQDFIKEHNHRPYIAIDNMEHWYVLSQDGFIQEAYGVDRAQKTVDIIQSRIAARKDPNAKADGFSITEDWQGIKALHRQYRDKLFGCGAHIVCTSISKNMLDPKNKFALVGYQPGGEAEEREGYKFHFVSYMGVTTKTEQSDTFKLVSKTKAQHYFMILLKDRTTSHDRVWADERITFEQFMKAIDEGVLRNQQKFENDSTNLLDKVRKATQDSGVNIVDTEPEEENEDDGDSLI